MNSASTSASFNSYSDTQQSLLPHNKCSIDLPFSNEECDDYCQLEIVATAQTAYGESLFLVGNLDDVGSWDPSRSVQLFTNQLDYPIWLRYFTVFLHELKTLQFKLVIVNNGAVVK